MRFILAIVLFTVFGFAQQNCQSEKTQNKAETAKAAPETAVMPAAVPANTPAAVVVDSIPRISLADAKKDFDAGKAIFIDTRNDASYRDNRIKGAINIQAEELNTRFKEVPKNKKIITYCS